MSENSTTARPRILAVSLIVFGVVGWIAAFALTIEKIALLGDAGAALGCDFSILVQCRANLDSWQGSVLGFPNPLIGLGAWAAPIAVGVGLLAGARFDRWFWLLFAAGVTGALGFVIWLISQSIFVLGTLCPWCMVTWSVTIPLFFTVWLYIAREGILPLPARGRAIASTLFGWVPAITVASYLVVAIIAQLRLDFLNQL